MDNRKVYGVRIDVEPKYVTEDENNRVYMSLVPVKKDFPDWEQVAEKALQRLGGFLKTAIRLFISYVLAYGTAVVAFHMAYAERGYEAIGGEYLLVIGIFFFTYWLAGKILQ